VPRPLLIAALLLVAAQPALALEPTTVKVEGRAPFEPGRAGRATQAALDNALEEAVMEVARLYLPERVLATPGTEERVRESLGPRAPAFVLTYRRHGAPVARPSRDQPGLEEMVLELTATVDAAQVRSALASLGLLEAENERPSVALAVRGSSSPAPPEGLFNPFAQYLIQALEDRGYVVVDPALHAGGGREQGGLDLARSLGTDVGVDVAIGWLPQRGGAPPGGTAEVRLVGFRARDGARLLSSRFDAPAYHDDFEQALLRALEALQSQVADNLILQLDRNWRALARDDGAVVLRLLNVSSFRQVEAVQRQLMDVLGARRADLVEIGPQSAEVRVSSPLSAGALQNRLAAASYQGFELEPVQVSSRGVSLRIDPSTTPDAPANPR
jgi:hypothetical protein